MKRRELHCTWHKTAECMQNGMLVVQQAPSAVVLDSSATVDDLVPVGLFCTTSALMSWCQAEGAMDSQRNAMGAKRRPRPAHPENRPTVQNRRSLSPRRS